MQVEVQRHQQSIDLDNHVEVLIKIIFTEFAARTRTSMSIRFVEQYPDCSITSILNGYSLLWYCSSTNRMLLAVTKCIPRRFLES